jgi:hypothetical protein
MEIDSSVPRTTPPSRPFAFHDPFAPVLGTSSLSHAHPQSQSPRYTAPTTTSSDYHYSPTAEPRRMSEVNPAWPHNTSPGGQTVTQSRGTSIATITLSNSSSSSHEQSPPLSGAAFNSRASLSALEHNPFLPVGAVENLAPIRPKILRYKTSPARFTGLGLHLVVKSQTNSSGTSTTGPGSSNQASRRESIGVDNNIDRRRSSGQSTSSVESRRTTGTWAVVDVVDKLSSASTIPSISTTTTTTASTSSSIHSLRTADSRSSMPNPFYTVEHISSRSTSIAPQGSDKFKSLPSRKGKLPSTASAFAYETISPVGLFNDPLAFPRRGSLAVLSQTALGPWASPSVGVITGERVGEELLGAPKGNWQDRRGSWAEGWSNTAR